MERDSRDGGDFTSSVQQLPDCFSLISGGMSSCYFVCSAFISRGSVENRIKKKQQFNLWCFGNVDVDQIGTQSGTQELK